MTLFRASILLLLCCLFFSPKDLPSCGPDPLTALYAPPSNPLEEFERGEWGILQPYYRRLYLAIAFRALGGRPLSDGQRVAVFGPAPADPADAFGAVYARWIAARKSIPGVPEVAVIDTFKLNPDTSQFYENCKIDAFVAAASALKTLVAQFGATSDRVRDWLVAQDMVFTNCSTGSTIPAALPQTASSGERADRAYQIAAAHFYSGQFDNARIDFQAIAHDPASPWRSLAPYLLARVSIRSNALPQAEKQLEAILGDRLQKEGHERARRLISWVRTRLYPEQAMAAASKAILTPLPQDLRQSLADYTYLYDTFADKPAILAKAGAADEMTNWIRAFQSSDSHVSLEEWRRTHSVAWLIGALAAIDANHPEQAELLRAANEVPVQSPGYLTVQYFTVRLLERSKQDGAARERLDKLLSGTLPRSTRNLLMAARMKIAQNWDDFLRDAQRVPSGEDGYDYNQAPGKPITRDPNPISLDGDATALLRRDVPLRLLASAALDAKLPSTIRLQFAISGWTRAVLLNRLDVAREVAPALAELVPELRPYLDAYRRSPPEAAGFEAAWTMLRNPGFALNARDGFGRPLPIGKLDNFRDNWWCRVEAEMPGQPRAGLSPALRNLYGPDAQQMDFLTPAERQQAASEIDLLSTIPAGPVWLADRTLKWGAANASDPRLPEALHLVVRASRYGCGEQASPYFKRAFQMLHSRYPRNPWVAKTPYWF